ncbi:MAG: hypothetical protein CM1200mP18_20050 [Gammaproteobacteria bacterium]|nr:MAG: hypothetical protein CM1200mP18_20050 [Gammaproteobacteria bacterium]
MWTAANQAFPSDGLATDYIIRLQVDFVDPHTIAMIAQNIVSGPNPGYFVQSQQITITNAGQLSRIE